MGLVVILAAIAVMAGLSPCVRKSLVGAVVLLALAGLMALISPDTVWGRVPRIFFSTIGWLAWHQAVVDVQRAVSFVGHWTNHAVASNGQA
jgi:hypothetical protein